MKIWCLEEVNHRPQTAWKKLKCVHIGYMLGEDNIFFL